MRRILILAALLVWGCADQGAQAAQKLAPVHILHELPISANWKMDAQKSSIKFTAIQTGESFDGYFASFTAQIKFDPNDLPGSKVIALIDLASADAGDIERTEAMPTKDWFYVKSFPQAKFESQEFLHLGGDRYQAQGHLTLRGIAKPIQFPFTLSFENENAHMQANVNINRMTYNIGGGMWRNPKDIGHEVGVNIEILANKRTP